MSLRASQWHREVLATTPGKGTAGHFYSGNRGTRLRLPQKDLRGAPWRLWKRDFARLDAICWSEFVPVCFYPTVAAQVSNSSRRCPVRKFAKSCSTWPGGNLEKKTPCGFVVWKFIAYIALRMPDKTRHQNTSTCICIYRYFYIHI